MKRIHTTKGDAIEQEIVPALGDYAGDYDLAAIADEVLEYVHTGNAAHDGFRLFVDESEFWQAVQRHEVAR